MPTVAMANTTHRYLISVDGVSCRLTISVSFSMSTIATWATRYSYRAFNMSPKILRFDSCLYPRMPRRSLHRTTSNRVPEEMLLHMVSHIIVAALAICFARIILDSPTRFSLVIELRDSRTASKPWTDPASTARELPDSIPSSCSRRLIDLLMYTFLLMPGLGSRK